MTRHRVLITRRVPPSGLDLLQANDVDVDIFDQDNPPTRDELLARVPGVAGLITMLSERVDADLLDAAGKSLKIVANFAVGYDNIDLDACRARNIRATNTPGVLTDATADLAWALILSAARRVPEGDRLMRTGKWTGWTPMQLLGLQLRGATLGLFGAGRIGTAVGLRAVGFGMNVIYTNRSRSAALEEQAGARRVEFDELLAESDVLSLHVPLTPETRHRIGAAELVKMKPTVILINTARGPLVDEAALVDALRERRIAMAGFDVYEHEPRMTPGLADLDSVVLLPHLGSATVLTRLQMSTMVAENVLAVLRGDEPPNPIA